VGTGRYNHLNTGAELARTSELVGGRGKDLKNGGFEIVGDGREEKKPKTLGNTSARAKHVEELIKE